MKSIAQHNSCAIARMSSVAQLALRDSRVVSTRSSSGCERRLTGRRRFSRCSKGHVWKIRASVPADRVCDNRCTRRIVRDGNRDGTCGKIEDVDLVPPGLCCGSVEFNHLLGLTGDDLKVVNALVILRSPGMRAQTITCRRSEAAAAKSEAIQARSEAEAATRWRQRRRLSRNSWKPNWHD